MLKAGFHWRRSRSQSRRRNPKSACDLVKIKNWSHKRDGIRVRRIRTFPFLPTPLMFRRLRSAYDLVKTRLSESEAEAQG